MYGSCPNTCSLKPSSGQGSQAVDTEYLSALKTAVPKNGRSWTYTHFPRAERFKTSEVETCINISCDSVQDAIMSVREGYPTVVAVPKSSDSKVDVVGDVRFVRCPAEYIEKVTCSNCGGDTPLCARHNRDFVVKFTAHGTSHKKVGTSDAGGCYGSSGPVAIQWKNTTKQEQIKTDAQTLTDWISTLPEGSLVRHHVVGDVGEVV